MIRRYSIITLEEETIEKIPPFPATIVAMSLTGGKRSLKN